MAHNHIFLQVVLKIRKLFIILWDIFECQEQSSKNTESSLGNVAHEPVQGHPKLTKLPEPNNLKDIAIEELLQKVIKMVFKNLISDFSFLQTNMMKKVHSINNIINAPHILNTAQKLKQTI